MPNTRNSVVKIGQLFGKEYCRFDEAVVRLYKPTATVAQIEQGTNPAWPPLHQRIAGRHRVPFRYIPPVREYDRHPVIVAVSDALRVQNYSYKTYKNYKQALITLIRYVGNKPIDEISKVQYQKYLLFLIEKKRLQAATINVHINSWKFYQEKVLLRNKEIYDVPYPRQPQNLPTVYSVDEVKAIFKATTSLKYRTLFRMVYATGMRLSEVAHLRLTDIDQARQLIIIKAGKGKKDRVVMLSAKLLNELNEYLLRHKPGAFLFEDITSGEPLAVRTIQRVYSEATRFGGIQKRGGIHSLRHSFATHLLESGLDIRYIHRTADAATARSRKHSDDYALHACNSRQDQHTQKPAG